MRDTSVIVGYIRVMESDVKKVWLALMLTIRLVGVVLFAILRGGKIGAVLAGTLRPWRDSLTNLFYVERDCVDPGTVLQIRLAYAIGGADEPVRAQVIIGPAGVGQDSLELYPELALFHLARVLADSDDLHRGSVHAQEMTRSDYIDLVKHLTSPCPGVEIAEVHSDLLNLVGGIELVANLGAPADSVIVTNLVVYPGHSGPQYGCFVHFQGQAGAMAQILAPLIAMHAILPRLSSAERSRLSSYLFRLVWSSWDGRFAPYIDPNEDLGLAADTGMLRAMRSITWVQSAFTEVRLESGRAGAA